MSVGLTHGRDTGAAARCAARPEVTFVGLNTQANGGSRVEGMTHVINGYVRPHRATRPRDW
jgi:hypothetical protein